MDINTLRSFSVVLVALAFAGVCWWAFSPRRKKRFEEAANLPFADEQSGTNNLVPDEINLQQGGNKNPQWASDERSQRGDEIQSLHSESKKESLQSDDQKQGQS